MTKFSSVVLVALLAFGAVWGQCAACGPAAQEHSCCNRHAGDCQTPNPDSKSSAQCPNVAVAPVTDEVRPQLVSVQLPAPVAVSIVSFDLPLAPAFFDDSGSPPDRSSSPDLYLLNSTLLV